MIKAKLIYKCGHIAEKPMTDEELCRWVEQIPLRQAATVKNADLNINVDCMECQGVIDITKGGRIKCKSIKGFNFRDDEKRVLHLKANIDFNINSTHKK